MADATPTPIIPVPGIPCDAEGPVFREPWEAQAFAIMLKLYQGGHFTWPDWVDYLSAELRAVQGEGDSDPGQGYYQHWLHSAETLLVEKGVLGREELEDRKARLAKEGS